MNRPADRELATAAPRERRLALLAAAALAGIAILAGLDLLDDFQAGVTWRHAVVEGATVFLGATGAALLGREVVRQGARARTAESTAAGLTRDVAVAQADAERWRREAGALLRGLSDAIDRQFTAWALSQAEQEVARLLLKGLSHKEIAVVRGSSEATVRQQATALYRKAGLAGRAELAAFFLEDLLAPPG